MKFFSSELGHEYAKTYTFGYCNYAQLEAGDDLAELYALGYLPYSGSSTAKGVFYMCRSGRVHLPDWELDSEARRVAKKFDDTLSREEIPLSDFRTDSAFKQFFLDYFLRAHGEGVMPPERFDFILDFGIITHVGIYRDAAGTVQGYSLEVHTPRMAHDWFHAWTPEYDKSSLGMYMLMDIGRAAKARGAEHYYCGTVYASSSGASYKTNLPDLEYWSGTMWIRDPKHAQLKQRLKTDAERRIEFLDEWKEGRELF